jgi:hypothetical protein
MNNNQNSNDRKINMQFRETTETDAEWPPLDILSNAAGAIKSGISKTANSISSGINSATTTIGNGLNNAAKSVVNGVQNITDKTAVIGSELMNKASEAANNLQNKASSLIDSAKNNISHVGTSLKDAMTSVSNLIGKSKDATNPAMNNISDKKTESPSDAVHKRISNYINELSQQYMKTTDMNAKRKLTGQLPETYPESIIKEAKRMREDKHIWNFILDKPTEIYRTCLYPTAKVNYNKWCKNSFPGDIKKLDGILN